MATRASKYPTKLELEILKVIWRTGPATVRQVREELAGQRNLAHTTVMTMMTIMTDKGFLKRKKQGIGYIYTPVAKEDETTGGMLGDIVERAFHGSTMAAMVHLLESGDIDDKELAKLRKIIRRKEKGA